jgi:dUTP pyrophosphatase
VQVLLVNLGDRPFAIARGERIAQLVVQRFERVALVERATASATRRGAGGFGSTGTSAKRKPKKTSLPPRRPSRAAKRRR